MNQSRIAAATAILLVSFCSAAFLVTLGPILSFVFDRTYIMLPLAFSLLGYGLSGLASNLLRQHSKLKVQFLQELLCILGAVSVAAAYFLLFELKSSIDFEVKVEGNSWSSTLHRKSVLGAFVVTVPQLILGMIVNLAYLSSSLPKKRYCYTLELVGAALGTIVALLLLEYKTIYAAQIIGPCAVLFSGWCFLREREGNSLNIREIFYPLVLIVIFSITPPPFLFRSLAPLWCHSDECNNILWDDWNSFTRFSFVNQRNTAEEMSLVILNNGDGRVRVPRYSNLSQIPSSFITGLVPELSSPCNLLVLFAGVGMDMFELDKVTQQRCEIDGIELNRKLIDRVMKEPGLALENLMDVSRLHLIVNEARLFLQKTKKQYDLILVASSGSTTANFVGSLSSTSFFTYTLEGVQSILNRLSSKGLLIFSNGNKLSLIRVFKEIWSYKSVPLSNSIIILSPENSSSTWANDIASPNDGNILLVKPNGFSFQDFLEIQEKCLAKNWRVAYSGPQFNNSNPEQFNLYSTLIDTRNPDLELRKIEETLNKRLFLVTDDKPFAANQFRTSNYGKLDFWSKLFVKFFDRNAQFDFMEFLLVCLVMLVSLVTIFSYPLHKNVTLNVGTASAQLSAGVFGLLGLGYMITEYFLIQKYSLILGNPSLSVAIVLMSLLIGGGLGGIYAEELPAKFRHLVLAIPIFLIFFSVNFLPSQWFVLLFLFDNIWVSCVISTLLLTPISFFMGFVFITGLREISAENPLMIVHARVINGALATVAAPLAALVAHVSGIRMLMYLSLLIYLFVTMLLLRLFRSKATHSRV